MTARAGTSGIQMYDRPDVVVNQATTSTATISDVLSPVA